MQKEFSSLVEIVSIETATLYSNSAAVNVQAIFILETDQQIVVRKTYSHSLQRMWILYVCVLALGLVASLFIRNRK